MRHDAAGFSLVEVVILVVIVAVVGAAGWAVKSHKSGAADAKPAAGGATKTYTDPARVYRVRYPAKWTVGSQTAGDNAGPNVDQDEPRFLPDDGVEEPCNAAGGCGDNVNAITVSAIKVKNADAVLKLGWYPVQKETINGYQAYFKQLEQGKSVFDDYFVFHDGVLLDFSFKPVFTDGFGDVTNDPQHEAAYKALVHTVKFLN